MQYNNLDLSAQNSGTPSLALFEERVRIRLEQFALNAQTPLEHYQQHNEEAISDYLELALIELRILHNDLQLLRLLKASKQG